jgi:hypothetical protein
MSPLTLGLLVFVIMVAGVAAARRWPELGWALAVLAVALTGSWLWLILVGGLVWLVWMGREVWRRSGGS